MNDYSIIEPRYPHANLGHEKANMQQYVFFAIMAIEAIIILILAIILVRNNISPFQNDYGEVSMESFENTNEMFVDDADTFLLLYAAGKNGITDDSLDFEALSVLVDSYVSQFGGEPLKFDPANGHLLSWESISEDYPYEGMRNVLIESEDTCAEFAFYPDFKVLHSYKVNHGVCPRN